MNSFIITNNLRVKGNYQNSIFIQGTFEDVLIKARDMAHEGYEIISHPIGASIRMLYSPYCSIIIGEQKDKINPYHIETIENSIMSYRNIMANRDVDIKNAEDYSLVDQELLKASIKAYEESMKIIN